MPVEFLTDEEVAACGRFNGPPCRAELERSFLLNDRDRELVRRRRRPHTRLGFALQLLLGGRGSGAGSAALGGAR